MIAGTESGHLHLTRLRTSSGCRKTLGLEVPHLGQRVMLNWGGVGKTRGREKK